MTTATEADSIIKKYVKSFEKNGDSDSALELMRVLSFTGPLTAKEFTDLPLKKKCEVWRAGGWKEDLLARMCGEMIEIALGGGWREDPAITVAMDRKIHPGAL